MRKDGEEALQEKRVTGHLVLTVSIKERGTRLFQVTAIFPTFFTDIIINPESGHSSLFKSIF